MEDIFFLIGLLVDGFTQVNSDVPLGGIQALVLQIVNSPGLLLFVLIPFVGLGIGLIKRIIKLN